VIVYLAGPISGETYAEATDWRIEFTQRFQRHIGDTDGVVCLDPMRGKAYLDVPDTIKDEYASTQMSSARGITVRDRFDTMRSDIVVMNLLGAKKVSIGSMIEAGWLDSKRIPLILVMEHEGNIHHHSMLREIASWVVPNLDGAEQIIRSLMPGLSAPHTDAGLAANRVCV
jgi:hypothetical protein